MISRPRLRNILTTLALYAISAALIAYFGINAYTGNHGLKVRADLDRDIAALNTELSDVKAERAVWQRRVSLLRAEKLDPDMLDERARFLLNYADPRDVVILTGRKRSPL